MAMAEHEPQPKRQKLSSIFEEFRKDEALIEILRDATNDLIAGYSSGAQFLFHEITEANARSRVAFTDATCDLEPYIKDPGAVAAGIFFKRGIAILKNYCDGKETESDIPKDPNLQNCLAKLLEFLSSGKCFLFCFPVTAINQLGVHCTLRCVCRMSLNT